PLMCMVRTSGRGRAIGDFPPAGSQRQIALEPQMLKSEREDGDDRKSDANADRWRNPPRANRGADGTKAAGFQGVPGLGLTGVFLPPMAPVNPSPSRSFSPSRL